METIHLGLLLMLSLAGQRSSSEILHRQKRSWIIDYFTIDEGYTGIFPYSLGRIDLEKNLYLFKIHGPGVDEEPVGVLQIDEYTGELTVHDHVDYEKFKILKLLFQAFGREKNTLQSQLVIEIKIVDSNDHPPKFEMERYEIIIQESTMQGTEVISFTVTDADTVEKHTLFGLKIVSVTPKPQDLEFYLNHKSGDRVGSVLFKGCLDQEIADEYTIIVEAKDSGGKFSSSCTIIIQVEDGNNHVPEITGETGQRNVKEGEENVLVSRLQVSDKDKRGTKAWGAKYHIEEDTDSYFMITTDPETNEGLLYLKKHLDYEETSEKHVTILVENEIPYHTCKVVNRRTTGLWEVVTTSGITMDSTSKSSRRVTVTVENVNEAPFFDISEKHVTLYENIVTMRHLETFTAKDPDIHSASTIVYIKGEDPANWVTVDRVSGNIKTSKALDRESHFVYNGVYKVTVYAFDDGEPPMTGTATLSIHIADENDNAPSLNGSTIVMCQSDGPSLSKIQVFDLDENPYAGPFSFKLLGDVEGKWRVDPKQGFSANLVKEDTIYSGHHTLNLEVSDLQQKAATHTLSVTVCDCLDEENPHCHSPKLAALGGTGLWLILLTILLIAGLLLLLLRFSRMNQNKPFPDVVPGQHLINFNTEVPGNDCELGAAPAHGESWRQNQMTFDDSKARLMQTSTAAKAHSVHGISKHERHRRSTRQQLGAAAAHGESWRQNQMTFDDSKARLMQTSVAAAAAKANSMHGISKHEQYRRSNWQLMQSDSDREQNQRRSLMDQQLTLGTSRHWFSQSWIGGCDQSTKHMYEILHGVMNKLMSKHQALEAELDDYDPHVYAEEGNPEASYDLDPISIPEISFDPEKNLHSTFKALASICMDHESTTSSIRTSSVNIKTWTTFEERTQMSV